MSYQTTYTKEIVLKGVGLLLSIWLSGPVTALGQDLNVSQKRIQLTRHICHLPASDVQRLFPSFVAIDPAVAFAVPCLPPVGFWEGNRISSGYGWRKHPISGQRAHHAGIDIAGVHQYVRASATGVIEQAGYDKRLGYYVRINHGNSYRTTYGHLARLLVGHGQPVEIGEKIGVLGQSGVATGLHLHYAVTKNGVHVDPAPYLTLAIRVVQWYQQQVDGTPDVPTR